VSAGGGGDFSCALLQSGGVDCWGDNAFGQLGDGTTTGPDYCAGFACSSTPVAVSGLTNATAVSTGYSHSCALLQSGGVDCWGINSSGELGDGTTTGPDCAGSCSSTPVAVSGLTNATAVAVGNSHSCALLQGGGVDCWGDNQVGELGDGTSTGPENCGLDAAGCSTTPVAVSGLTNATAISAASGNSCALLQGGGVYCWGDNQIGQLGDGTSTGPETCYPRNPV
jgi:alpha-tubulin suppressor-like RCC1 family protein